MTLEPEPTLVEYFRYTHWANRTLLDVCATLDAEVVNAAIPGAYGSIVDTFVHILRAEVSFLKRIQGAAPVPPFAWDAKPTFAQLTAFEVELAGRLMDLLRTVSPTDNVHEEGQGWLFDYQARLIFMSVAYHGIAHRTDITTYLNRAGVALPELDVWAYQAAYPDRFQARVVKTGA